MSSRRSRRGGIDEANRGETKGEVREQSSLAGHLTQRCLRRGNESECPGGPILQGLKNTQKQGLAGSCEQIDAIEISEPGQELRINFGEEPLAGVATAEAGTGKGGSTVQQSRKGLFADAGLSFDGGELQMRRDDLGLLNELAPCGADRYKRGRTESGCREIEGTGLRLPRLYKILHRHLRALPRRPGVHGLTVRFIGGKQGNVRGPRRLCGMRIALRDEHSQGSRPGNIGTDSL